MLQFRRATRAKLVSLGVPPAVLEGVERATIMRNKASVFVEQGFSEKDGERFRREMDVFLSVYELDSAKASVLFPDCVSTLETIRELGARIGLVTNTSKQAVDIVFETHGIGHFFDVVVTRDCVRRLKPDPEGILLAVKKLGVKRFYMVGDLILDVLAAKSSRGVAILASREVNKLNARDAFKSLPEEVLREFQTTLGAREALRIDYVIQSLSEIPAIIQADRLKAY